MDKSADFIEEELDHFQCNQDSSDHERETHQHKEDKYQFTPSMEQEQLNDQESIQKLQTLKELRRDLRINKTKSLNLQDKNKYGNNPNNIEPMKIDNQNINNPNKIDLKPE